MRRAGTTGWFAGIAAVLAAATSCGGKTVRLGDSAPPPYHFFEPVLLPDLASSMPTDNPTLTSDLLEIFFTTNRDVWHAQRASPHLPFESPGPIAEVNSDSYETSPAISADGLTLWFGSDRPGGSGQVDIWVSERTTRGARWSTPMNLVGLNSPASDIPRPPGQRGLVMPMASTETTAANPTAGNYQTYWAIRTGRGAPFAAPVPIPELAYQDRSTVDAFLTDDGLTMFFSSTAAPALTAVDGAAEPIDAGVTTADLFVAFRRSTDEPFAIIQPLSDLNTSFDERDPWLSPDGTLFYFTSDRGGVLNIYTASVKAR
jgi:hypothetical protein